MELLLLLTYLAVAGGLVFLLVRAIRSPSRRGWLIALGCDTLCLAAAVGLTKYFDALPGTGMMPGLTWFAHTFYSMGAAALYGVLLCVTVLAAAVTGGKRK